MNMLHMHPRASHAVRVALSLGLLCTALSGCPDDEPEPHVPSCDDNFNGRALEGDWTLTGRGRRSECTNRRMDGALEIRTGMPISVEAAAQATTGPASGPEPLFEADAFVQRIERADYVLALDSSVDDEIVEAITFQGGVNGACVSFDLIEELPGGDEIEYHFDGFIVSSNRARGNFFGVGPGECEVEGEFELVVR